MSDLSRNSLPIPHRQHVGRTTYDGGGLAKGGTAPVSEDYSGDSGRSAPTATTT
jgi:hypothetical protein